MEGDVHISIQLKEVERYTWHGTSCDTCEFSTVHQGKQFLHLKETKKTFTSNTFAQKLTLATMV